MIYKHRTTLADIPYFEISYKDIRVECHYDGCPKLDFNEFAQAIRIYFERDQYSFIKADIRFALSSAKRYIRNGALICVIKHYGVVIGMLIAAETVIDYTSKRCLTQVKYVSNLSGGRYPLQCMKIAHEAMEQYARLKGFDYLTATCSHLDIRQTYARILEKLGWKRSTYLAYKDLHEKVESSSEDTTEHG